MQRELLLKFQKLCYGGGVKKFSQIIITVLKSVFLILITQNEKKDSSIYYKILTYTDQQIVRIILFSPEIITAKSERFISIPPDIRISWR